MALNPRSILFFIVLALLVIPFTIQYGIKETREDAIDFASYYYAAKLSYEMDFTPYNNHSWKYVRQIYPRFLVPFMYPPTSLLFFRLFLNFDYETAKILMLGINHVLTLAFALIFFFNVLRFKSSDIFPFIGIYYLYRMFYHLLINYQNGQVSLFILLSVCLAWLAVKEKWHPIWIAVPLAFGIGLKLYPAIFLLIFFIRKEYKPIIYTLGILFLLSVIATIVLPRGIWQDWYSSILSQGRELAVRGVNIGKPGNQSIQAFTTRLFFGLNVRFGPLLVIPEWAAKSAPHVLSAIIVCISWVASWLLNKSPANKDQLDLQFSIWLLVMFMVAPFSWDYHLVHIIPAIYVGFLQAWKSKNPLLILFAGSLGLFIGAPYPFNTFEFRNGIYTLLISAQLYAVFLLWVFLIGLSFAKWKTLSIASTN